MRDDALASDSIHQEPSEAKNRVKSAALALFSERGFPNVSVRDIMTACGLTGGALYAHYKSKEEVLQVLIQEGQSRLHSRLEALFRLDGSPPERLSRLAYCHMLFQLNNLPLARIASREFRYLPEAAQSELDGDRHLMSDYFDKTLTQGVEAGLFQVPMLIPTRMAIIAAANFAPQWYDPAGETSAVDLAKWHADMSLRVVMAQGAAAIGINAVVSSALEAMDGGWPKLLARLDGQGVKLG